MANYSFNRKENAKAKRMLKRKSGIGSPVQREAIDR